MNRLLVLLSCLLLAACGQTGPLRLPETKAKPAAEQAAAPAEEAPKTSPTP